MSGKILKISSNDLYGNVDDRNVRVYACFLQKKYMNNYVIFSIEGINKLCYGSIYLKENSLVIFSVKKEIEKYILEFLDEYMNDQLNEFKILNIDKINKVELVSYSEMDYNNLQLLDDKTIQKVVLADEPVKNKKPIFLYLLLMLLMILSIGITLLYFKPEWFMVKYKGLECSNTEYDNNMLMDYDILKDIRFDSSDKVLKILVTRSYNFLESDKYYSFKNSDDINQYFINGETFKFVDDELKFKIFYDESNVIDDYDEMLTYLKSEGYECVEKVYEE